MMHTFVRLVLACLIASCLPALGANAQCPPNAHPDGEDAKHRYCKCNAGFAAKDGVCTPITKVDAQCAPLKQQIDQMKAAARHASLAQDVYYFFDDNVTKGWQAPWKAPPGYTLLSNQIKETRKMFPGLDDQAIKSMLAPDGSTYRAAIYRDNAKGTIVVAFRGTDAAADWKANIPNELGVWTAHFGMASALGRELRKYADRSGLQLEIVGHSLGGGLAIAASAAARAKASVFNAETVHQSALSESTDLTVAKGLVTSYITPREPLSSGQGLFLVPAPGRQVALPDWRGSPALIQTHPIDAFVERHVMRSVRQAVAHHVQTLEKSYTEKKCVQ